MITRTDYGGAYQTGFQLTVRFLISRGVPPDSAEETAQAAWAKGWEHIANLRTRAHLRTWVNTIALNLYRRVVRNERRTEPFDPITFANWCIGGGLNVAAIDVATVLAMCDGPDRLLLIYQMSGLTTSEMAVQVGVTEGAVRVRLMRARQAAKALAGRGRTSEKANLTGNNVRPGTYCLTLLHGVE